MDKLTALIDNLIFRHVPVVYNRQGTADALREAYEAGLAEKWYGSDVLPEKGDESRSIIAVLHTGAVKVGEVRFMESGLHEFAFRPEWQGHKSVRHVPWTMVSKWCFKPDH